MTQTHLEVTERVLRAVLKSGLTLSLVKTFVGHWVSEGIISRDSNRQVFFNSYETKNIYTFEKSRADVRNLEYLHLYSKFIYNYEKVIGHSYILKRVKFCRKSSIIKWLLDYICPINSWCYYVFPFLSTSVYKMDHVQLFTGKQRSIIVN